ncbi:MULTISPECIES: DUF485 domain-containing protein [unclassified Paludibacterium]|uniref:DUF485 domain-containing protein n=1 Tax=unclassified Paludibacterium TaxID=2618429 RepID=UPI001C04C26A|nr:DUF485 domain-containing protein [Paludibacterium sp. B53371]BEV73250.1 hypothetical protein THUN1379_27320 [Paludibacterium sp. THUN1379]
MKSLLLLLLLPIAAFYGAIAFFPALLAIPCGRLPLSMLLALGLIWLGVIVSLLYVRQANRREDRT